MAGAPHARHVGLGLECNFLTEGKAQAKCGSSFQCESGGKASGAVGGAGGLTHGQCDRLVCALEESSRFEA